ncbi:MAG: dTDP-4-dehydrorhamnose 3,5-epimerase family protein [Actinobacteria bacterium]|nr:dTDP-4-dehydrorhamnose 3,5-epimerase family protein [Actinomycetota bacterium]
MIPGVIVRELPTALDATGYAVDLWGGEASSPPYGRATLRHLFPGRVEAWFRRKAVAERVICLQGMIKLVLCDRREGSQAGGEVMELFLGEYRFREVAVPPGVLRGWKAVGGRPALVLLVVEGEGEDPEYVGQQEAAVPYDWEIVMR